MLTVIATDHDNFSLNLPFYVYHASFWGQDGADAMETSIITGLVAPQCSKASTDLIDAEAPRLDRSRQNVSIRHTNALTLMVGKDQEHGALFYTISSAEQPGFLDMLKN